MSNSGGELSRRKRIRHIMNAAAGIPFLATLNCILLAVWIYFALQSNEFPRIIYRTATTEEKEDEQYASVAPA